MARGTLQVDLYEFAKWCEGIGFKGIALDKPLREISLLLTSATRQNFERQTSPEGVPWVPFKRTPSARRGGRSAKLLRDTGLLMSSYAPGGAGHVESLTLGLLVWGSNLARADWHQFGTRTIPARPHAGITAELMDKIEMILSDYVESLLSPPGTN